MNLCRLRIPVLLTLALSIPSYAQTLGDVARELRAERKESGSSHTKIITNEDIIGRTPPPAPRKSGESEDGSQDRAKKDGGEQAEATHASGKSATKDKDADKEREEQEAEIAKRTEETNKVYLDRIDAIRKQIDTAQEETARLQRDQAESSVSFQRTAGTSPNPGTYAEQQRVFNEQIAAHHDLINSLISQLEDAKEAARHAGVPHASD